MSDTVEIPVEDAHLLANNHFLKLGEFLGIDDREDRLTNKKALEEVLEWAKAKSDSQELVDILLHIRSVERGLVGNSGEPRITKLRRYIALEQDQEHIDKEMELLKG